MRLLLVNTNAAFSGAERVLARVAEVALEAGHEVSLVAPSGPVVEKFPDGVRHVAIGELNLRGRRDPATLAAFATRILRNGRLLRRMTGPGTVTVFNNANSLLLAARPRGRVVALLHDVLKPRRAKLLARYVEKLAEVVSVSDAAAQPLRDQGVERIVVVHNGTDLPTPEALALGAETRASSPLTVGVLAALTPWKGQHVLIEAFARIASRTAARLEVTGTPFPGDEAYEPELRALAARLDVADRVDFVGHIDATAALQRWAVMVLPSLEQEAMPLSVLEAMAWGCPVISTDHGGAQELLRDGVGGLVPPGDVQALADALLVLLDDPRARAEHARLGLERVQHFEAAACTRQQLDAILG